MLLLKHGGFCSGLVTLGLFSGKISKSKGGVVDGKD